MSRTPVVLLVLSLLVLVACSGNRPEPAPPQPTSDPIAVVEPSPTTVLDAILANSTPTGEPYPAPNALATAVPYPAYPDPSPAPTEIPGTPPSPAPPPTIPGQTIVSDLDPLCVPEGEWIRCTDAVLGLGFEYPSEWGTIDAVLREGGQAGLAYQYYFSNQAEVVANPGRVPVPAALDSVPAAGGRSSDFSEGRGGTPTDFLGYGSGPSGCARYEEWSSILSCRTVAPNVIMAISGIPGESLCAPMEQDTRLMLYVEVDLAQNPTINGFRVVSTFLSEAEQSALDAARGDLRPDGDLSVCNPDAWAAYDAYVDDLVRRIEAGQMDEETQRALDRLERFARSITAPTTTGQQAPDALIVSDQDPTCTADGAWIRCSDPVLGLGFEYPAEWGQIDALLREGQQGGRAYQYYWSEHPDSNEAYRGQRYPMVSLDRVPISGGRSDDFREGRQRFLTDFSGYDETLGCATYEESLLIVRCREIAPNVILVRVLATAEALCTRPDLYAPAPYQVVELDLPDSEMVNGFRVLATFLSEPEWTLLEAQAQLLTSPGAPSGRCTRGMQAAFDAYVDDLLRRIEAGEVDEETQRALEHFERFATSITLP